MPELSPKQLELNRRLCESRQAVRECFVVEATAVSKKDAADKRGVYQFRAKVMHADKINRNRRIYPSGVVERVVKTAMESQIPQGKLTGAVDHLGWLDGGNLKDTVIMWRQLQMQDGGAVYGEFDVIEGHSKGKDLLAQIEAGMAVGFSTFGYGTAHEPSDEERARYNLGELRAVVMNDDYELTKIDAVDDPAVEDARIDSTKTEPDQEQPMKTLEELKAKHPELFAMHETAVKAAKDAGETALTAEKAQTKTASDALAALKTALSESLAGVFDKHQLEKPYKEIAQADAAAKIEKAEKDLKAEKDSKTAIETELAGLKDEAAERQRKEALATAIAAKVAKHKFEKQLKVVLNKAAEAKSFKAEMVDKLVADKTAEYEALIADSAPKADQLADLGITGTSTLPEEGESTNANVLPLAAELAKVL